MRAPGRTAEAASPELQAFDAGVRGEWRWTQPKALRSRWELRADGACIATLEGSGVFGRRVQVTLADGAFVLESPALEAFRLRPQVRARRADPAEDLARAQMGWFGHATITLPRGETLLWRRESFWIPRFALMTPDQLPLVHLRPRVRWMRLEGEIALEDAVRRRTDLPVLLALGWYLMLRHVRHQASGHGSYA